MGPGDLQAALRGMASDRDARILVGISEGDDAGVVRLSSGRGLVHTIDVITPIVDDPETFGRIAAANAISDVYAMGGRPTSAVAFLAVPKELPRTALPVILRGGRKLLEGEGAALVGGHSVKDKELKLGFAITGEVLLKEMMTVAKARAGQRLILTKPLGTGIIFSGVRAGKASVRAAREAAKSMMRSNREARDIAVREKVRCGTDVTGFGLAGHALNIARHSGVDIELDALALPTFDGVAELLALEIHPGATEANLSGFGSAFRAGRGVSVAQIRLAADPQTSGGLLLVVPARQAERLASELGGWIVGRVLTQTGRKPQVRLL